MVAVLGLLIVGAVHLTIAGYISAQSERNDYLKKENAASTRKSRRSRAQE